MLGKSKGITRQRTPIDYRALSRSFNVNMYFDKKSKLVFRLWISVFRRSQKNHLHAVESHSESFVISGGLFIVQLLNLIVLIAYVWLVCKAIARASKMGNGVEVPMWIFAIVLLPIFGAVSEWDPESKTGISVELMVA